MDVLFPLIHNFSAKMKRKDELEIPGTILPICCAFLSTGAKTVWRVDCNPRPFGELGLKVKFVRNLDVGQH